MRGWGMDQYASIIVFLFVHDFYEILMSQAETKDIALSLGIFVNCSLSIFDHQINVAWSINLWVTCTA